MPPRSKISQMPENIRSELDRRLVSGGFSDYRGLTAWLVENDIEISIGAVQRHGSLLQERTDQVRAATEMAQALVAGSPDDGGAMSEAALRLIQERMFDLLLRAEEQDLEGMAKAATALAKASRANNAVREERRKALAAAADVAEQAAKRAGIGKNVIAAIRRDIEGGA